jgi:pimeloyl-ACP methyl ester carboxylesterase
MSRLAAAGHDAGMRGHQAPPAPGGTVMTVDEAKLGNLTSLLSGPAGTRLAGGTTAVLARPGARLAYQVTGEGPAVVLVHGFGLDMRMWDPQVEPLAAQFRVVRYDCRGFGASGPLDPAVPYTQADDLVALLDHLAIADAVLVGLSFGGRVALQTALAAPARVRGLALLGAVLDGVPWDPGSRAPPGSSLPTCSGAITSASTTVHGLSGAGWPTRPVEQS